jgi:hypothetical protein
MNARNTLNPLERALQSYEADARLSLQLDREGAASAPRVVYERPACLPHGLAGAGRRSVDQVEREILIRDLARAETFRRQCARDRYYEEAGRASR